MTAKGPWPFKREKESGEKESSKPTQGASHCAWGSDDHGKQQDSDTLSCYKLSSQVVRLFMPVVCSRVRDRCHLCIVLLVLLRERGRACLCVCEFGAQHVNLFCVNVIPRRQMLYPANLLQQPLRD